jgi:hypothetical protein
MTREEFLKLGLFKLDKDGFIIEMNEDGFDYLNMVRHPDRLKHAFWSNEPKINGFYHPDHFYIRFAAGFSGWMNIRANPKIDNGWWYQDDKYYTFYDESKYSKHMTFGELLELMKECNCKI